MPPLTPAEEKRRAELKARIAELKGETPSSAPPPTTFSSAEELMGGRPIGLRGDVVNPVTSFPETGAELALGAGSLIAGPIASRAVRAPLQAFSGLLRAKGVLPNLFAAAERTGQEIAVGPLREALKIGRRRAGTPASRSLVKDVTTRVGERQTIPIKELDDLRQLTGEAVIKPSSARTAKILRKGVGESLEASPGPGSALLQRGVDLDRARHALFSKPTLREILMAMGLGAGGGFGTGAPGMAAALLPRANQLRRAVPFAPVDLIAGAGLSRSLGQIEP